MCGIFGFSWRDEGKLAEMAASLHHRGPDGAGEYFDDRVSIGHTRLSIIDLTETGRQPMSSPDDAVVVSYNGEIYNFRELRSELEGLGHAFRGTSDTEVLLHAYLAWGTAAFSRFNGMWAACIYDRAKSVLLLTRDRLGVKPLHYTTEPSGLVFASEVKAILCHDVSRAVDPEAVDLLLSAQFIPSPRTIFRAIRKVEPRQLLTYELTTGALSSTYYYDIPRYDPIYDSPRLVAMARDLLEDAVRIRLVADVPVGAFLSGGVDSTTVVAVMRKHVKGENLHTVSVGFDIPGLDESEWIHLAQRAFGTNHHHIIFKQDDGDQFADDLARTYDDPVADPSSFPTWRLCEETRKWMTVALSGDGGDEIFGGYSGRQVVAQFELIRRAPRFLRRAAHAVLAATVGYRFSSAGKLTEALRVSLLDPAEYAGEIGATLVYRPESYKRWTRERLRELLPLSGQCLTEAMLKFDIYYNRLGDNYAAKVDRMSMAHSIEVRSPFLDYRFMEFASRIPVKWKLSPGRTKILMRELVRGLIPDAIIDREKHGFAGPLGSWVGRNKDELRGAVDELFAAGVLDEPWRAFFLERVFTNPHPIYREYMKRLFFLWRWHRMWGAVRVVPEPTAAPLAELAASTT
jgi:asparagine synthase (glutamine-hydrolysing)